MFCWTLHLKGGPYTYSCAAVAVKHKVFTFGGRYEGNRDQMDVNVFNTVSLRWRKLTPETNGRAEGHLEGPSYRWGHTAVLIEDVVYIWAGYCGVEYCNMLYAFDVDTHLWVRTKASGTVPEWRSNHSACDVGKVMYVYGGYNRMNERNNDIYKLDSTTMVWTLINTRGTPPHASSSHSATIIGTKMFVFGGWGRSRVSYNNISVFDTETSCWLSTPSAQLLPEGRWSHSAFTFNGELYIYGGNNWDQTFNDLWKYNLESFSWKKVEPKGKCQMHSTGCCMVGDCVILFDRWNNTTDDLFILDLNPSLKTLCKLAVIQYGLDQSELTHDIRWELAAMTTVVKSSVQVKK